jgi:hypothetical protein
LYDLEKDKSEMNNLFGKAGYEKITTEMKAELLKLVKEYKDVEAEKILIKN